MTFLKESISKLSIKLWPRRLSFQLAIIISLLLAISMASFSFHGLKDEVANITSYMELQAGVLAKNIAATGADHLLRRDYTAIEELLVRSIEFPGIQGIQLTDKSGKLLGDVIRLKGKPAEARYGQPSLILPANAIQTIDINDERMIVMQPIILGELLGWIKITYSLDKIKATQQRVIRNNIIVGLIILLLTVILLLTYIRRTTKEVESYTNFAVNLNEIKGKNVVVSNSSYELEQLGSALNSASENLHEQNLAINSAMTELERLAAFPENNPNIVLSMNMKGDFQYLNPYGEDLLNELNLSKKDLNGLLPEDYINIINKCLSSKTTAHAIEKKFRERVFLWTFSPVINQDIVHGYALEITQRRNAEKQTHTAQTEKFAAESANIAKSAFLANMSHEIRTPLTAIIGFSESLLDTSQSLSDRVNSINTVIRSGKHLLQIINDILDISKVEAEKLELELLQTSIFEILSDTHSLTSLVAAEKGLFFNIDYEFPLPEFIYTDPVRLKQIIINLCTNAVKFTSEGGVDIKVSCDFDNNILIIKVVDTGIGLSSKQMSKIFNPFTQADSSTTREYGGTGLGLHLSKQLAEKLGGDISVESVTGKGCTFTVSTSMGDISKSKKLLSVPEIKPASIQPILDNKKPMFTGKVLLTEDNTDNQRLISMYLNKMGAGVTIANNGEEAIKEVTNGEFDLILMDMQMPIMNGVDATKNLRGQGYKKPIVALTANVMKADVKDCFDAGCDDFIQKPIIQQQFLENVSKYLKKIEVADEVGQPITSTLLIDEPEMLDLVERFVSRIPQFILNIKQSYENKNWDELRQNIHNLKGTSGNFGFEELYEISTSIEFELIKENYQGAHFEIECLDNLNDRIVLGLNKDS